MTYVIEDYKSYDGRWFGDGESNHLIISPESRSFYYYREAISVFLDYGFTDIFMIPQEIMERETEALRELRDTMREVTLEPWTTFVLCQPVKRYRSDSNFKLGLYFAFSKPSDFQLLLLMAPPSLYAETVHWENYAEMSDRELFDQRSRRRRR